ncbi:hypothetical protein Tco_0632060, partial [Tanacetum coccineum]
MKTKKSKVDTGKALDAGLVVIEISGTESEVPDESNSVTPPKIRTTQRN